MNKKEIISFFDKMAAQWDEGMIKKQSTVNQILDYAVVKEGSTVLDVACGTGVLIPDYLERRVKKIVGVDISSKMISIARKKFGDRDKVAFFVGDMEEMVFDTPFDCIVVYNAFPHFCNPEILIKTLAENLSTGGSLCIAHGMSKAQIDRCHQGSANLVSNSLIHEDEMEKLFLPYFDVHTKISNEEMYAVAGTKK